MSNSPSSRSTKITGAAGLIIALVAVAAITGGSGAVVQSCFAPSEARTALGESQALRAVAAAVAKAARELAGAERIVATLPEDLALVIACVDVSLPCVSDSDGVWLPPQTVGERLLDLPPPRC